MLIETTSAEETKKLAAQLGSLLQPGDVLLLNGDLGAGKTTFTQGLAEGLGIDAPVTSPTFTLVHEYRSGRLLLFHFDSYRLAGAEEIADLGFEEYLERSGVVVVEWAERLGWLMPDARLDLTLSGEGDTRTLQLEPHGSRYEQLVKELEERAC
jgi:tRNA threonylcarbamoyladenosine biosynthesis protein TsaE